MSNKFNSIYESILKLYEKQKILKISDNTLKDVRKYNIKINSNLAKKRKLRTDGEFIFLFHGTSNANMKKINKSGKLKSGTFFGQTFETSELFAKRNHGDKSGVNYMAVWMGSLNPSGEYWVSNEELYFKNSKYIPKNIK